MGPCQPKYGFTLIELLVVIVIISILTLIGINNLMESSTRAKVSRTKNDMRVVASALELYHADHNAYVTFIRDEPGQLVNRVIVPMTRRLSPLTTPIAYITTVPRDVFETVATSDGSPLVFFDTYDYADVPGLNRAGSNKGAGATSGAIWRLSSAGPDRIQSFGGDLATIGRDSVIANFGVDYDPTNGPISAGDIVRVGPPSTEGLLPAIRRANGTYEELFRNYD
jgi:prepilin-type N-terminal cleavage/methylation domain-containing protein